MFMRPGLQVGRYVEGPTEFYSGRLTKKERKETFADEFLANPQLKAYRYNICFITVGSALHKSSIFLFNCISTLLAIRTKCFQCIRVFTAFWFFMAGSGSTQRFKSRKLKVAKSFISRRIGKNLPLQRIKLSHLGMIRWISCMKAVFVLVVYLLISFSYPKFIDRITGVR
jgi:hypothetical protein